jgi:arginase
MKIAAVKAGSNFFMDHPRQDVPDGNHLLYNRVRNRNAKRIDGIVKVYQKLAKQIQSSLESGKFPVVLSGDHSSAGGTIAGIKAAYPEKRLGVIWIDAHADMHTPYTSPSGNVHGMPLSTATNEDNLECKNAEPGEETVKMWEALKATGIKGKKVDYRDIVFIALRDFEKEERALIERNGVKVIETERVRNEGASSIVKETMEYLKDCDMLYISFDVDSIDKSISAGTGTPVENGIYPEEGLDLLLGLLKDPRVNCLEFTEVNPLLDEKNKMAEVAFGILDACGKALQS